MPRSGDNQAHRRWALPRWTTHPGVAVAALVALTAYLIVHGEPQPSSRPSGRSVVAETTAPSTATALPTSLIIRNGVLERLANGLVTVVKLPAGAVARSVISANGMTVALASIGTQQNAYLIGLHLRVIDLGAADSVSPAVSTGMWIETSIVDPGLITLPPDPSVSATPTGLATVTGPGAPSSSSPAIPAVTVADWSVHRVDPSGRTITAGIALPSGMRFAVDTPYGITAWRPLNAYIDGGAVQEASTASAALIRPDGTERMLGDVHPLAASLDQLLVFNVARREFGVLPLRYVNTTAITTASPTATATGTGVDPVPTPTATPTSAPKTHRSLGHHPTSPATEAATPTGAATSTGAATGSPTPSAAPTTVAGARWFAATRGFLVTGPATFNPAGTAFAVYAQVGNRRRLVVAKLSDLGTDQIDVLSLAAVSAKSSSSSTSPGATPTGSRTASAVPSTTSTSTDAAGGTSTSRASAPFTTASPTTVPSPIIDSGGFPVTAPLRPLWWGDDAVALIEGSLVEFRPGAVNPSLVPLPVTDVTALAELA